VIEALLLATYCTQRHEPSDAMILVDDMVADTQVP